MRRISARSSKLKRSRTWRTWREYLRNAALAIRSDASRNASPQRLQASTKLKILATLSPRTNVLSSITYENQARFIRFISTEGSEPGISGGHSARVDKVAGPF